MEPFKNLINVEVLNLIGLGIKKHYAKFDQTSFLKGADKELASLELKERVAFIAKKLHDHLPTDPKISIPLLVKSLDSGIGGFSAWPLTHFVATYGLDHFELSMNALKEMTKIFTSEFAVRPFFIKDEKRTLKFFNEMIKDKNEHVRRWASEGSRPLLPWGQKLHGFVSNPELTWGILEKLKDDPSEYVRKSVANHINDHSKNHPEEVIEKLLVWHKDKKKSPERDWVIRHASRSLIKKGFKKAFLLHGVEAASIKISEHKILTKKVKIGESLKVRVSFQNLSKKSSQFIIDHEIHLLKANNKHLIKVFKGKKMTVPAGVVVKLDLSIAIKPVTTRVYYSGIHHWNIKINGESSKHSSFELIVK